MIRSPGFLRREYVRSSLSLSQVGTSYQRGIEISFVSLAEKSQGLFNDHSDLLDGIKSVRGVGMKIINSFEEKKMRRQEGDGRRSDEWQHRRTDRQLETFPSDVCRSSFLSFFLVEEKGCQPLSLSTKVNISVHN